MFPAHLRCRASRYAAFCRHHHHQQQQQCRRFYVPPCASSRADEPASGSSSPLTSFDGVGGSSSSLLASAASAVAAAAAPSSSASQSIHVPDSGEPHQAVIAAAAQLLPGAEGDADVAVSLVKAANEQTEAANRLDIYKAIGISAAVCIFAGILDHEWVDAHQALAMSLLFCLGYAGIMLEEILGLNKAGVALLMAVSLWTIRSDALQHEPGMLGEVNSEVTAALASVSELIFFLLGAMTVVEVVDSHGGFKRLASWVRADSRSNLAWFIAVLTFLMSAALDNLTTTIVMISILQRAVPADAELRKVLGAVVVVAANAGGAWTPIGDVTTTMLWIHGQLTAFPTMRDLLVPSFVAMACPVGLLCATSPTLQGPVIRQLQQVEQPQAVPAAVAAAGNGSSSFVVQRDAAWQPPAGEPAQSISPAAASRMPELKSFNRDILVLSVGVGALLFVPVFKQLTGLPPYMGILSGLAVLWLVTDALHFGEDRSFPRVQDALRNLDIAGVMFFLGVLMSVEALNAAGLLGRLAETLAESVPNIDIIAGSIGIVSALIDNVPLVAATMGMYDLATVPPDSQLWQLIALCAGTGGSLLVIGSAAGVAYMGLEGVGFGWYVRHISPWVLAGYGASIASYVVLHGLPSAAAAGAL